MNILLLQLKMIGDAILTTPVMRCLRDEIPGCRITLAVRENVEGLLPLLDSDRNLVFRGGAGEGRFGGIFSARGMMCVWTSPATTGRRCWRR